MSGEVEMGFVEPDGRRSVLRAPSRKAKGDRIGRTEEPRAAKRLTAEDQAGRQAGQRRTRSFGQAGAGATAVRGRAKLSYRRRTSAPTGQPFTTV